MITMEQLNEAGTSGACISLLYISTCMIEPDEIESAARQIIESSLARNPLVGLSGALLCTGPHFAQVIEGSAPEIDRLMQRLYQDSRHADLRIMDRNAIPKRLFADWSMAYIGPSQFVSNYVTRLLGDVSAVDRQHSARLLIDLLREFALP